MFNDLSKTMFGNLQPTKLSTRRGHHGEYMWDCICKRCGRECRVSQRDLLYGLATNCGCVNGSTKYTLAGDTIGHLTVLHEVVDSRIGAWTCLCSCGRTEIFTQVLLLSGAVEYCSECSRKLQLINDSGCLNLAGKKFGNVTVLDQAKDCQRTSALRCQVSLPDGTTSIVFVTYHQLVHGTYTGRSSMVYDDETRRILHTLSRMKQRCYDINDTTHAERYSGRGIRVCREWIADPFAFVRWARANGYAPGLEIDRIDNDGPYSPENCRWVTGKVNCSNRSSSRFITIDGVTKTFSNWFDDIGLYGTKRDRYLKLSNEELAKVYPQIVEYKQTGVLPDNWTNRQITALKESFD